jgi:uncharacterized protein
MKCPTCDVDLVMTERSGVEIDYCPKCRGVWLDRGELDKIIERSAADSREAGVSRAPDQNYREPYGQSGQSGHEGYHNDPRRYGHGKHKRRSALEELFDFGD